MALTDELVLQPFLHAFHYSPALIPHVVSIILYAHLRKVSILKWCILRETLCKFFIT